MRTTDQNTKKCWRGLGQFLLAARRWLNCTQSKRKTLYRQILQQMEGKLIQTFASAPCRFVCCLEKMPTKLISRDFPRFSPVRNQLGSECCFLSCNLIGWIPFHWSSLRDDKLPTQSEDINKSHWSLKFFHSWGFYFSIEIFQAMHICLNLLKRARQVLSWTLAWTQASPSFKPGWPKQIPNKQRGLAVKLGAGKEQT